MMLKRENGPDRPQSLHCLTDSRKNEKRTIKEIDGILYITKGPVPRSSCGGPLDTLREKGFVLILKEQGYWGPIMSTIKFGVHFGLVIGLLFCGAWVFARFEDPDPDLNIPLLNSNKNRHNHSLHLNRTLYREGRIHANKTSTMWSNIQKRYNIFIKEELRPSFLEELNQIITEKEKYKAHIRNQKLLQDRDFIWMKWFYFTTICTTTIGYGDVSPQTSNGRLFYIFFSIVGIATMMTLMKECGAVLTLANKKFYAVLNHYICGPNVPLSQELLAVFSIVFLFFCFFAAGIWYDITKLRNGTDWTYVNVIYFWIVTFTTVGFDTPLRLERELQHVYPLLLYRLFGLSFLAGVIDSLTVYAMYRKELFKEKAREFSQMRAALLSREQSREIPADDDDATTKLPIDNERQQNTSHGFRQPYIKGEL